MRTIITIVISMLPSLLCAQKAAHVVISEFATRGPGSCNSACEFVELYNPTDKDVDAGGWKLQYRSASGSSYSTLAAFPAGAVIRSHGYYLITPAAWAGPPAADAVWAGSGMADNGSIRITDASNTAVDRVSYGSGNDPEGTAAPNHGDQANNNSVERKAAAASTAATLGPGGAEEFDGNGYDSDDNSADFIVRLSGREPQNASSPVEPVSADGSGSAYSLRGSAKAGQVIDVSIVYFPLPGQPPADLCILIPPEVQWSSSPADVTLGDGVTAAVRISADSLLLEGIAFAADSGIITLAGQAMPMSTGVLTYTVLSRTAGGVFRPLKEQPAILVQGGPIPISEARENNASGIPVKLNEFVTVNGKVTAGKEFGAPAYIQDATGGIAVYDFAFTDSVEIGEEVTITGKVTQYAGLTELTDVVIDSRHGSGGEPHPLTLTAADILSDGVGGIEKYEGLLVRLNNVTVNTTAWTVNGAGTNYRLRDATGEIDVRIDKDVNLANAPAPGGSFDLTGIVSQYQQNSPFIGGYQLMPRRLKDVYAAGPRIVTVPTEENISSDAITLVWQTGADAISFARFGETEAMSGGTAPGTAGGTEHSVTISGLSPATIYWVQPYSTALGDTSFAQPFPVITSSESSTGAMNVYFNKSVDNTVYPPLPAQGNTALKDKLLDRIDAARHSIDMALYSFSGATGDDVAASLLAAYRRGVKIRAIFETDNATSAAVRALRNEVPVILDNFDPVNAGAGLMHNKFFVIDARDRSSDTDDWVMTGSWNVTDQGTLQDAQNLIEIQDQALAVVYTREFEEMWGSAGETPYSAASRFGARKRDDTPRLVNVGGTLVETYFSPSDRTTEFLRRSIAGAGSSAYFCILTFTRDDLAAAFADLVRSGKSVRGIFDNSTDQGSKYNSLKTSGADVFLKKNLSGLLHHKYMIIDADAPGADQNAMVITGSHNWSNSAEFSNNENTIGVHSALIARQYLQEWYQRYKDAGGTAVIVLGTGRTNAPRVAALSIYPNPVGAGGVAEVSFGIENNGPVHLDIIDVLGRTVATLFEGDLSGGGRSITLGLGALRPGTYFCRLMAGGATRTVGFLIK